LEKAILYFEKYHKKNPTADTVLYYLHDCYRKQGDVHAQIHALERLADLGVADVHVYKVLLRHYSGNNAHDRFFESYLSAPPSLAHLLDKDYTLTRELYAKLLLGAIGNPKWQGGPMDFAITKEYMPTVPSGAYYKNDTMTIGNLIITLDRLLEPIYPADFYPMTHISERSFLYLPYMRLVDRGILTYERDVHPDAIAPLSITVNAIHVMTQRGYID
jgi:hypothetical protein